MMRHGSCLIATMCSSDTFCNSVSWFPSWSKCSTSIAPPFCLRIVFVSASCAHVWGEVCGSIPRSTRISASEAIQFSELVSCLNRPLSTGGSTVAELSLTVFGSWIDWGEEGLLDCRSSRETTSSCCSGWGDDDSLVPFDLFPFEKRCELAISFGSWRNLQHIIGNNNCCHESWVKWFLQVLIAMKSRSFSYTFLTILHYCLGKCVIFRNYQTILQIILQF